MDNYIKLYLLFPQYFSETEPKRFTLPLFGNLGRSISVTNVGSTALSTNSARLGQSLSNPSSMLDLTISPPISPNGTKPLYMPHVNRRQRRASLVRSNVTMATLIQCYYNARY